MEAEGEFEESTAPAGEDETPDEAPAGAAPGAQPAPTAAAPAEGTDPDSPAALAAYFAEVFGSDRLDVAWWSTSPNGEVMTRLVDGMTRGSPGAQFGLVVEHPDGFSVETVDRSCRVTVSNPDPATSQRSFRFMFPSAQTEPGRAAGAAACAVGGEFLTRIGGAAPLDQMALRAGLAEAGRYSLRRDANDFEASFVNPVVVQMDIRIPGDAR